MQVKFGVFVMQGVSVGVTVAVGEGKVGVAVEEGAPVELGEGCGVHDQVRVDVVDAVELGGAVVGWGVAVSWGIVVSLVAVA